VAARLKTDHRTLTVTALDTRALLGTMAAQLDEPLGDAAAIPTYLLSRFAREHVKVALTGEGADELFAGYHHYRVEWMMQGLGRVPLGLRRAGSLLAGRLPGRRVHKALVAAGMDQTARFVFVRSVIPEALRRGLMRADATAALPPAHLEQRMAAHFPRRENGLNAVLQADLQEWLPDNLLTKVDKTSMLASLEARVPFLDHHIVEMVSGFPAAWKCGRGRSKVLLKSMAEPILPADIVHRRKRGFSPPVRTWLRGDLRPYLEEHLLDPSALSNEWLEPKAVRSLVGQFMAGRDALTLPVWVLLCLEVWLREGRRTDAAGAPNIR
jgi:asparagine synthase (glutamine-hydrolysing)